MGKFKGSEKDEDKDERHAGCLKVGWRGKHGIGDGNEKVERRKEDVVRGLKGVFKGREVDGGEIDVKAKSENSPKDEDANNKRSRADEGEAKGIGGSNLSRAKPELVVFKVGFKGEVAGGDTKKFGS